MHVRQLALTFAAWSVVTTCLAHKPSDSYLAIDGDEQLSIMWDLSLKDLELHLGIDADQNGEITWGELKARRDAIAAHALARLELTADGAPCPLQLEDLLVAEHSDGAYAVLVLSSDCRGDVDDLAIQYSLWFDVDPTHRGLVIDRRGAIDRSYVLSPQRPQVVLQLGEASIRQLLAEYIGEGIWHIWIGYDHILFLLALLLPSVYRREDSSCVPVDTFRPAASEVLKIVTVFTVAHSITLWLAVMEYVSLPAQWIEATIAFSIIVTAANNLWRVLPLSGWSIAFLFGLVHGFGFANVLIDLGLSDFSLAISLLGFNLGVELGQIVIVLAFLPIAFWLRHTAFYRSIIYRTGSAAIAAVAAIWFYERVANVEILGF